MTTVVYRDGVLAADRRSSFASTVATDSMKKVFRTPDKCLGGFAGSVKFFLPYKEWARGDRQEPAPKGDYVGILVHPDGSIVEYERGNPIVIERRAPFVAWGSGSTAALGALHAGADARTAVLIAQKVDKGSGGGVDTIKLSKD
jgi:20S proteasome alpha/beta subunit